MQSAPIPASEPQRLEALRSTALLDTAAEPAFDELVTLTARLLGAPIAAFNLVDVDRQWTKAGFGMANGDEAPREALLLRARDRRGDDAGRARHGPGPALRRQRHGARLLRGTPVTVGGQRIGTLCVAGEEPHTPSDDDLETLRVLASAMTAHVELARRERERADEATMLRRLGEATSRLARVSDAAEFETELCAAACELAGADAAVLWTAVPGGMLLAVVDVGLGIAGTELPPGHGAGTRVAFDRGERDYRTREQGLGLPEFGAGAFQPLAIGERTLGVLTVLWRSEPPDVPERELQLIELLSGEAAVAIQRTTTLSELEKLTRVDALTGIGNRRAFDEQLTRELKRAEREGNEVALGMFDLDHFKAYNDAHGHPAGDRLLAEVAAVWEGCLRATDSLARYGGEEFALVAPGCSAAEVWRSWTGCAPRCPRRSRARPGVALWDGTETIEALLARADAALYAAKVAGRDQTCPRERYSAARRGLARRAERDVDRAAFGQCRDRGPPGEPAEPAVQIRRRSGALGVAEDRRVHAQAGERTESPRQLERVGGALGDHSQRFAVGDVRGEPARDHLQGERGAGHDGVGDARRGRDGLSQLRRPTAQRLHEEAALGHRAPRDPQLLDHAEGVPQRGVEAERALRARDVVVDRRRDERDHDAFGDEPPGGLERAVAAGHDERVDARALERREADPEPFGLLPARGSGSIRATCRPCRRGGARGRRRARRRAPRPARGTHPRRPARGRRLPARRR